VTGGCSICGHEREDVFHILLKCPHAAALWAAMREVWDILVWKGGGTGEWRLARAMVIQIGCYHM
jgi:hypothetical protein